MAAVIGERPILEILAVLPAIAIGRAELARHRVVVVGGGEAEILLKDGLVLHAVATRVGYNAIAHNQYDDDTAEDVEAHSGFADDAAETHAAEHGGRGDCGVFDRLRRG